MEKIYEKFNNNNLDSFYKKFIKLEDTFKKANKMLNKEKKTFVEKLRIGYDNASKNISFKTTKIEETKKG